jgi:hypothetical protein
MTSPTFLSRPLFSGAWEKFKYIYGDGDLEELGKKIGGKVKTNIDLGKEDPQLGFTNGCAIRMSYAFNYTGAPIPFIKNEVSSGNDGKWYIYRVRQLISFLNASFGPPDLGRSHPMQSEFKNEKGILIFEVNGWSDAQGHATLWNGVSCSDNCYFPQARNAHLWRLR